MGIDVEREHTDSDKIAREIAMDHEDEFPRYYDALADMEKDMEEELDYDEVLYIMKDYGWGDGIYLHQDDFEDSHYYDGESTPEEYAKAFDKYMDDLSTGKLEDYLKGEKELGLVTKKWSGIGKEIFTSADNYILEIKIFHQLELRELLDHQVQHLEF